MGYRENIYLNLYCDEVKEIRLEILGTGEIENWTYIGILIVPEHISLKLFKDLSNLRCLADTRQNWTNCKRKCIYHDKNNTEIHYSQINNTIKYRIADRWVEYWLADSELIYYYILGVNTIKLDKDRFGPKEQQDKEITIYNRFFRTALQGSLNLYFGRENNIIVKNIFHDKGSGENHHYFPWHSIYKTEKEYDNIKFENKKIEFIDSDHRNPEGHKYHSQFIQLMDIILGCYVNCLHNNSTNKNKLNLAEKSYKLVNRIINNPYNKNSRYKYFKRQSIQFFPKYNLSGLNENDLEYQLKRKNNFNNNRPLLIESYATGQLSFLDDMLSIHNIGK